MTVALLVLVCLLGAMMFVLLGAQVELFRQVQQIREFLDLEDRPAQLDLGKAQGLPASAVGLPAPLDDARSAMVLFLTNKCATCRSIGASLKGALPQAMWLIVESLTSDDADGDAFVEEFQLASGRTLVDPGGRIAARLGLDITPSAVFVEDGRLRAAKTVPSSRQMFAMLPVVYALHPSPSLEPLARS